MATRIYCPKCEWAPGAHDRWMCTIACGTVWNTFETHGRCPGCSKQWEVTQCLACLAASPHDDWYHDEWWEAIGEYEGQAVERELVEVG